MLVIFIALRDKKTHVQHDDGALCPLAPDPTGKLDVLWHDGHTLGVDGAQVGVFKQTHLRAVKARDRGRNKTTQDCVHC